jgi:hypothetical protein
MFPDINRSAIILTPKQPFYDWLKSLDASFSHSIDVIQEKEVILIPDFEDDAEAEKWLKKNFDLLFTNALWGWYMDERMWVSNRTFEMFKAWFDYEIHLLVLDLSDDDLEYYE